MFFKYAISSEIFFEKKAGRINESIDSFSFIILGIGHLSTFLIGNNLVSDTTMSYSQHSNVSSGQTPQESFVQPQLALSGTSPSR
jgi:hypothetical protein